MESLNFPEFAHKNPIGLIANSNISHLDGLQLTHTVTIRNLECRLKKSYDQLCNRIKLVPIGRSCVCRIFLAHSRFLTLGLWCSRNFSFFGKRILMCNIKIKQPFGITVFANPIKFSFVLLQGERLKKLFLL